MARSSATRAALSLFPSSEAAGGSYVRRNSFESSSPSVTLRNPSNSEIGSGRVSTLRDPTLPGIPFRRQEVRIGHTQSCLKFEGQAKAAGFPWLALAHRTLHAGDFRHRTRFGGPCDDSFAESTGARRSYTTPSETIFRPDMRRGRVASIFAVIAKV